jgi:hypothetical protein
MSTQPENKKIILLKKRGHINDLTNTFNENEKKLEAF